MLPDALRPGPCGGAGGHCTERTAGPLRLRVAAYGARRGKYPLGFFKAARAVLTHFLSFYPTLYNYIDLRYPQAVRFALMLGGHTAGHRVYIHGAPFQLFIFRRNQLWEEQ